MKICPDCQKPIPEDSALCPYCLYAFEVKKPAPQQKPVPAPDKPSAPKPEHLSVPKLTPNTGYAPKPVSGAASNPAPAPKPAPGAASNPAPVLKPEPVPKPKQEFKPKLPSMTLGQEPMTDPEAYSSSVHKGRDRKKIPWYLWAIIVAILIVVAVIAYNIGEGRSVVVGDLPPDAYASPDSSQEPEEPAASPSPEAEIEEENPQQLEYVIADSDSRYLSEADLDELTPEERRIARNEIYARHHRLFDDEVLQDYFNGCSWYEGTISPSDFSEAYAASVFNEYELYNKDFILAYENENK